MITFTATSVALCSTGGYGQTTEELPEEGWIKDFVVAAMDSRIWSPTTLARQTPVVLSSQLLGFPATARVLVVNCDDLGMDEAINAAVFASIEHGIAASCSLLVPPPAARSAMDMLRQRPSVPFGIHLTLVRDAIDLPWSPLAPGTDSLLDASGRFFTADDRDTLLRQARIEDVEREFRAQIDAVARAGLSPTHLDFHCLADGGRPDILDLTVSLAVEHGLAVRVWLDAGLEEMRRRRLPVVDNPFLDSFSLDIADKPAEYERLLRDLPAGLTEWAVHPSTDPDSPVRYGDYEFLTSPQARELIRKEGITVIDYRPIQAAWR